MKTVLRLFALAILILSSVRVAGAADAPVGYQGNPAHTGAISASGLTPPLLKKWSIDVPHLFSYPLVAEDKVFALDTSDADMPRMNAFDVATGNRLWRSEKLTEGLGNDISEWRVSGPTYDAGKLFIDQVRSVVTAISAESGAILWNTQTKEIRLTNPPVAAQGFVYVAGTQMLYALHEYDGGIAWTAPISCVDSNPAVNDDGVYIVCGSQAYRFDPHSGVQRWHHTLNGAISLAEAPAVYNGKVYFRGSSHNPGFILDANDGHIGGNFTAQIMPTFDQNKAFFVDKGSIEARDNASNAVLWKMNLPDASITAPPLIANHTLYISTWIGDLYSVDTDTGTKVWHTHVFNNPLPPDPVLLNQAIYGGTTGVLAGGAGILIVPSDSHLTAYNGAGFPTIVSVTPLIGPITGGNSIAITGTNFGEGAKVAFGGVPATNIQVANATTLIATAPAHAPGAVDVVVSNVNEQTATLSKAFTYGTPPIASTAVSFAGDTAITGVFAENTLAPPFGVAWTTALGRSVGYPLVAQGKVFVTSSTDMGALQISALDLRTGHIVWGPTPLHSQGLGFLAYDEGKVFAAGQPPTITAFDAETGKALWTDSDAGPITFPVARHGTLYFTTQGGITALHESDGTQLWHNNIDANSTPAVTDDGIYVGLRNTHVVKLNAATGIEIWQYAGKSSLEAPRVAVYDNKVFTGWESVPGSILDATTGTLIGGLRPNLDPTESAQILQGQQTLNPRNSILLPLPVFFNGRSFQIAEDGLHAVEVQSGHEVWKVGVQHPNFLTSPAIVNGNIYVLSTSGVLSVFAGDAGTELWQGVVRPTRHDSNIFDLPGVGGGFLIIPTDTGLIALNHANDASTPYIGQIAFSSGSTGGGMKLTLTGFGFAAGAKVQFGDAIGTDVQMTDASSLTCIIPPHAPGSVDLVVVNPNGARSASVPFTYIALPTPTARPIGVITVPPESLLETMPALATFTLVSQPSPSDSPDVLRSAAIDHFSDNTIPILLGCSVAVLILVGGVVLALRRGRRS